MLDYRPCNEYPERTLKEETLAEWEAISRKSKRRWAETNGHDCISLQHDGIVLALRAGVTPAHVEGCLGDFASLALGYPMPVTLEAMEHADLDPPPPVLDSVGWTYRGGGGWASSRCSTTRSMGLLMLSSPPKFDADYLFGPSRPYVSPRPDWGHRTCTFSGAPSPRRMARAR